MFGLTAGIRKPAELSRIVELNPSSLLSLFLEYLVRKEEEEKTGDVKNVKNVTILCSMCGSHSVFTAFLHLTRVASSI